MVHACVTAGGHTGQMTKSGKKKGKVVEVDVPTATSPRATAPLRDLLRVPLNLNLETHDASATPGYPGEGKKDAPEITDGLGSALSEWQERLYADGRTYPEQARNVLVILQGLDTSGKGGVIRSVFGMVDPQGLKLTAFKQPTSEERRHHYLWRIRRALPGPGLIGIFDRSHYEDVLVVRVDKLVDEDVWSTRFDEINAFERKLAASGTTIVKCFLHITPQEQKLRLQARLDNPNKHWKYSPGDVDVRRKWYDYQVAYTDVLTRCNTEAAPWFIVPSDRKWYRNWAVAELLLSHLEGLDPQWPIADFDVAAEKARLAKS